MCIGYLKRKHGVNLDQSKAEQGRELMDKIQLSAGLPLTNENGERLNTRGQVVGRKKQKRSIFTPGFFDDRKNTLG